MKYLTAQGVRDCRLCGTSAKFCNACGEQMLCHYEVIEPTSVGTQLTAKKALRCPKCTSSEGDKYEELKRLPRHHLAYGARCPICISLWPADFRACPRCREATRPSDSLPNLTRKEYEFKRSEYESLWYELYVYWFGQKYPV